MHFDNFTALLILKILIAIAMLGFLYLIWGLGPYFRVIKLARIDYLDLLKCPSGERDEYIAELLRQGLAEQATLLCHRGEQLARHIIEEYGEDDIDARLMKRKLAFMKGRQDLFTKYMRLPYVVYAWDLSDDKDGFEWIQKSKQFEKDWEEMESALQIIEKAYGQETDGK